MSMDRESDDFNEVRERVSRFLSGLLRHFPDRFSLKLDRYGWAELEKVAGIVGERYRLSSEEATRIIKEIVESDPKGRFELADGMIRARYGHSVKVDVNWSEGGKIPPVLYHGTSRKAVKSILEKGLLPMKRREVHLCENVSDAVMVGRRYDKYPVVLKINARKMLEDGYTIRRKGKVLTTDYVPPEYISVHR